MPRKSLDHTRIIETIERLHVRINERFPDAGLGKVCTEFLTTARDCSRSIEWISQPLWALRAFTYTVVVVGLGAVAYAISLLEFDVDRATIDIFFTLAEATINDLVLLGAAIFFLLTLENRVKRSRAIKKLNELRALAHVVDMHQLTKDPTAIRRARNTEHSPVRTLNDYDLKRYLDYCSEMLSLIGKVAALYSQSLPDDVVVAAANDIEDLSTGLSRKIWQKLIILHGGIDGG